MHYLTLWEGADLVGNPLQLNAYSDSGTVELRDVATDARLYFDLSTLSALLLAAAAHVDGLAR